MAETERVIHVKLTCDASEYLAAMERAREATQALIDLGIDKRDIPAALATVTKLSA